MKTKPFRTILVSMGFTTAMAYIVVSSCKKEDKVEPLTGTTTELGDTLFSKKITTAPTIDGAIEALWDNLPQVTVTATVPNTAASVDRPGCDVFGGYEGKTNTVKVRAAHDATNAYFLFEWTDPTLSADRESWFFDPVTKRWEEENRWGCDNGTIGPGYYEDKFSVMWNINSANWDASTCYSNCHTGLSVPPFTDVAKHYTNATGEKTDVWHWKYDRTNFDKQMDDQYWGYVNPSSPSISDGAGRFSDAKTGGGYSDNKQTLKITEDTTISVSVPKYVIPNRTNYYWITKDEVTNGTAKTVTAVDSNGVLTYSGGTIDPSSGGFAQGTGNKRFPSIYLNGPFTGSRGDVTAYGVHTGSGWILEAKRALNTGFSDDAVFSVPGVQKFGIGVFEQAAIAHSIKTNMVIKFEE